MSPTYRSLLTVAAGSPVMESGVDKQTRLVATWAGVSEGMAVSMRATAPETCGQAIEVPEIVLVALSEVAHAALIDEPGAWMSTQLP